MDLHTTIEKYLIYCELQKGLNSKTIKAYRIDLSQFKSYAKEQEEGSSKELICSYLESLHSKYKPKSIKRKLATLKAFYEYLTYEEIIEDNPFSKIHLKIKEAIILPKIIPEKTLTKILNTAYQTLDECNTACVIYIFQYGIVSDSMNCCPRACFFAFVIIV